MNKVVSASPVKSFFVHMLTRDILLDEAILDLLDNCVDGIQRSASRRTLNKHRPYDGYYAEIQFDERSFSIRDNCGGIPEKKLEYAFLMGKHRDDIESGHMTVGVYGIGMKRAIFKIGRNCAIQTCNGGKCWEIPISEKWMNDESSWDLPVNSIHPTKPLKDGGTYIKIDHLTPECSRSLGSKSFLDEFREAVSRHYAIIISKGFSVTINGEPVKPAVIRLAFSEPGDKHKIEPYVYKTKQGDVEVFLTIGFTGGMPSVDEANEAHENYKGRYSSESAGWTIICNDRVVTYCDKTRLTGWGVSGAPQYHTQFIAISGIVEFTSLNPGALPTTTTKRGINANSDLYMAVRDRMVEGLKIFTRYTNEWKTREHIEISRSSIKDDNMLDLSQIKEKSKSLRMSDARTGIMGNYYKPALPKPKASKQTKRISFERDEKEIEKVALYLFEDAATSPAKVGDECFSLILKEAQE